MANRVPLSVSWLMNDAGQLAGYIDQNGIERSMTGAPLASEVCNVSGVNPDGTYAQFPNTLVVDSRGSKSYVLGTATNAQWDYFDAIEFYPGDIGQDGWYELDVVWGANNSANVKNLFVYSEWNTQVLQDSLTTNQSSRFTIKIVNRGAMNSQVLPSNNPISGAGGSSTPVVTLAMDLSQPKSSIYFAGQLAASANGDSIWIESWTLKACNPPVYSTKRLNYGKVQFYGANAHFDDSQSIAQHIADLKTMGMKTLRLAYEGPTSLPTLISYAQAVQADNTGIQICMCIALPQLSGYSTEAAAYADSYQNWGYAVALALAPYGVTIYEAGNELDTSSGINPSSSQGGYPSNFSGPLVAILRGEMRGCIDGVHAAGKVLGKNLLCASNAFTVCSLGLAEMLWNGTMPDGSSGYPPVRWDLTNWHNYEDYGPLNNIELGFEAPYINLFASLNRRFGVPIIVTEWNAKSSDTDAARAEWANRFLTDAWRMRYRYNIAFVCVYELYGSPWNVMSGTLGVVESTFGTTVQTFITNHPDTGT